MFRDQSRGAVALAEELPRSGHGQGSPAAQEPAAHDAVADRVAEVRLEEERCALVDGLEPTTSGRLPEVDLRRSTGVEEAVPAPVGDAHVRAHPDMVTEEARPQRIENHPFDAARPDVVVSDIEMPGEDGYALIAKIRSSASSSRGRYVARSSACCKAPDLTPGGTYVGRQLSGGAGGGGSRREGHSSGVGSS